MKKTEKLKIENKWLRIDGKDARTYPLPKRRWYTETSTNVIKPIASILYDRVPVNWKLVDNLRNEEVMNPILLGHNDWVYVGSQRLRALQWLYHHEQLERTLLVCKFTTNELKLWNLWGGNEGKKCAAIQAQLWEILFKSQFYGIDKTHDGKNMHDYEIDGDKMYWKVRDADPFWKKEVGKKVGE